LQPTVVRIAKFRLIKGESTPAQINLANRNLSYTPKRQQKPVMTGVGGRADDDALRDLHRSGACINDAAQNAPLHGTMAVYEDICMSEVSTARQNMVDCQVRPSDVTDLRIIDAMLEIPREAFVPSDRRALAYLDMDLDVGGTPAAKEYLIKPAVLAKMLQAAEITEADRVLVTGCATGYAAAVVARLAGEVFAVASTEETAAAARTALGNSGTAGVTVSSGPAGEGHPASGPYDVIVLNGATEIEPETLYKQLKVGGRLVGVFATTRPARATLVTRSPSDYGTRALFDAAAPVLPGLERLPAFSF
jgi:protein-L-isoaspartate(D-aspartate) O-methyltransferase